MSRRGAELLQLLDNSPESKEPALNIGFTSATIATFVGLALQFFPGIDPKLASSIMNALLFIAPIAAAYFIHRKVWSPFSVAQVVQEVQDRAVKTLTALTEDKVTKLVADKETKPRGWNEG